MIREPFINPKDKNWMIQLKQWCKSVKEEIEKNKIKGDNVTTRIRNGVISANVSGGIPSCFDWGGYDADEDEITIGDGFIDMQGQGTAVVAETVVATSGITSGDYYLGIEIDGSSIEYSYFVSDVIINDDVAQSKFYRYLYKIKVEIKDDEDSTKTVARSLDMRNSISLAGF